MLGTSTPALGELRHGAENSNDPAGNLALLRLARREWKVWAFGEEAAAEYGRLRTLMARSGQKIGAIDLQTAAIARTLGRCTVVTMDGDFSRVPGLAVEDWSV